MRFGRISGFTDIGVTKALVGGAGVHSWGREGEIKIIVSV